MSCAFSQDQLALHVEGDLSAPLAREASQHLEQCAECRDLFEGLRRRQSLLKSLRRDTAAAADCTNVRARVMAMVNDGDQLGWALRLERSLVQAFRRPSYALATFAVLGLVSATVFAQMRSVPSVHMSGAVAMFDEADALVWPAGYEQWVALDASPPGLAGESPRVYIDPESYRGFVRTGAFPEGTMLVWEPREARESGAAHPHNQFSGLLASVKDGARFAGGWGFFEFASGDENAAARPVAIPASSGCRNCHLEEAGTDSVFTQFYTELRSVRQHS